MSQRMLRGMAAGLGALVSLGSMAGCGTDGQVQKVTSIKIGVTVYDQYDTFVSQMMTDFNEYAAEQEEQTGIAINVEVYNAAGSQSTQNSQVEEMLDAGCNVICVNLVDRTEPTTIIDMAEKNNVPVIFFNRELVEEDLERWDRVYYVGAKAFESGIMQGRLRRMRSRRIRMLIRTVTVSSSMWCWREKPGIRMRSCAPSMRSQRL